MATLGAGRALARLASRSPQHTHGAITTARTYVGLHFPSLTNMESLRVFNFAGSLGTAANMTAEQVSLHLSRVATAKDAVHCRAAAVFSANRKGF